MFLPGRMMGGNVFLATKGGKAINVSWHTLNRKICIFFEIREWNFEILFKLLRLMWCCDCKDSNTIRCTATPSWMWYELHVFIMQWLHKSCRSLREKSIFDLIIQLMWSCQHPMQAKCAVARAIAWYTNHVRGMQRSKENDLSLNKFN